MTSDLRIARSARFYWIRSQVSWGVIQQHRPSFGMLEFQSPAGLLDGKPPSWYAVIRPDDLKPPEYDGTPRAAADGAEPRILTMEAGGTHDVFVSEYAETLGYITDSWFPTREAALDDSDDRFGEDLGQWLPVPENESHPESFVLRTLASNHS